MDTNVSQYYLMRLDSNTHADLDRLTTALMTAVRGRWIGPARDIATEINNRVDVWAEAHETLDESNSQ